MIAQYSPTGFVVAVTRWRWGPAFCEKWGELWVFIVVHACVGALDYKNTINQGFSRLFIIIIPMAVMYGQYLEAFVLVGFLFCNLGYVIEERRVFYYWQDRVRVLLKSSIKSFAKRYRHHPTGESLTIKKPPDRE
jgi:hypothetical protein